MLMSITPPDGQIIIMKSFRNQKKPEKWQKTEASWAGWLVRVICLMGENERALAHSANFLIFLRVSSLIPKESLQ